jgi:hypothetical protein
VCCLSFCVGSPKIDREYVKTMTEAGESGERRLSVIGRVSQTLHSLVVYLLGMGADPCKVDSDGRFVTIALRGFLFSDISFSALRLGRGYRLRANTARPPASYA